MRRRIMRQWIGVGSSLEFRVVGGLHVAAGGTVTETHSLHRSNPKQLYTCNRVSCLVERFNLLRHISAVLTHPPRLLSGEVIERNPDATRRAAGPDRRP